MRRAAESGDAGAQFNLGVLYFGRVAGDRLSIAENRAEAVKWLRLAADQGLPRAQSKLAEAYAEGPDTPKSHMNAYTWFNLAALGSSGAYREIARTGYEREAAQLSAAQLAIAQHRARIWKPTAPQVVASAGPLESPTAAR